MMCGGLRAPATRTALQHVPVMQQAVRAWRSLRPNIAQQLAPVLDRAIRGQQSAEPFVTTHDDLQQILCGLYAAVLRIPKSSMISSGTVATESMYSLRVPSGDGVGQFNRAGREFRDREPCSPAGSRSDRWPAPDDFFPSARPKSGRSSRLLMKAAGGQIENQTAIDLGIEREVEVVEALVGNRANPACFVAALPEPVGAPRQFIADETGD